MRFLLHGPMTAAVADALRRHDHTPTNLTDAGLPPDASPAEVLAVARKAQLDLLTTDAAMAGAPFLLAAGGDKPFNRSVVFLQLEGGDVEQDDAIDRLFARYRSLTPGRLYTVTASRVKIRQLPGMS